MFYADEVAAFLWTLVTAALSLCLGVLLRYKHATGTVTLALALDAFFAAEGVFQIVISIAYREVLRGAALSTRGRIRLNRAAWLPHGSCRAPYCLTSVRSRRLSQSSPRGARTESKPSRVKFGGFCIP